MAKITLNDLASLANQTTALSTLNSNWGLIEVALENTLSRDGTTPNSMEADLDMNSNQILNCPDPTTDQEPATKSYVDDLVASTIIANNQTPANATYLVQELNDFLANERVVTDSTSIVWDWGTVSEVEAHRAALTGDVSASENSNTLTLATVNADVGEWGDASHVPVFTVNGKGLVTAADELAIEITSGAVTDFNEAAQDAVGATLTDTAEIDLNYDDGAGQITATIVSGSIDETKLDTSVNASLDLADSSLQSSDIGSSLQAWDNDLDDLAALTHADGNIIVSNGTDWIVESGSTARTSLGLGTNNNVEFTNILGTGDLTVQDAILFTGTVSDTISANTDDYAPTGHADAFLFRVTANSDYNLTGLAGGVVGRIVVLFNIGSGVLTLTDEDTSSSAANRFALSSDAALQTDQGVILQYDGTSSLWRLIGGTGSGAGATLSDTAPTSPVPGNGDFWIRTTDMRLFVFYDDGDSTQWVDLSGGAVSGMDIAGLEDNTTVDGEDDRIAFWDETDETVYKTAPQNLKRAGGMQLLYGPAVVSNVPAFEFDLAAYNAEFTVFKVFVKDLLPATDNTDLYLRMSDDGGSTFEADASDYAWVSHRLPMATATTDGLATGDDADTKMQIHNAIGNATDEGISLEITILNPQASTQGRVLWSGIFSNLTGAQIHIDGGGVALWSTAKTDFQLLMSSGNFSANISVYGVF